MVAPHKNYFYEVRDRLAEKGIDLYIDGPSLIYIDRKTGFRLVEFIDGLGPSAERLALESELKQAIKDIQKLVQSPLNQNQIGALASFVSHIGVDRFAKSDVLRALNDLNYEAVPKLMQRFRVGKIGKYSRPTIRADYVARRKYEAELFSTADHLNWQNEIDDVTATLYPAQHNLNFNELRAILRLAKKRAYNKLGIFF
tara:strand:+ start:2782 stop:3378 length:597 start_codon:yes stop_codon:yes gene_type:complete